jgi:hypothetical protein
MDGQHQPPQQPYPYAPPPPAPYAYPPYPYFDPGDHYVVGQDDGPDYLHRGETDNPAAVTGFSFSICGLGLLVLSGGIAFLVTIPCSIVGMVVGRRGMKAVDSGRATRHRRYAKAGFVVGIVTCCLSAFLGLSLIAAAVFPGAFKGSGGELGGLPAVRLAIFLVRLAGGG